MATTAILAPKDETRCAITGARLSTAAEPVWAVASEVAPTGGHQAAASPAKPAKRMRSSRSHPFFALRDDNDEVHFLEDRRIGPLRDGPVAWRLQAGRQARRRSGVRYLPGARPP